MSIFRYDSRHKIIVGAGIVIVIALHTLLHGRERPTYDNGQVKHSGSVVMGRNHGLWTWYHPNGRKRMQGRFERGKRTGLWVTFSEIGDTLTTAEYANDRLNGASTVYAPDNRPVQVIHYRDDVQTAASSLTE